MLHHKDGNHLEHVNCYSNILLERNKNKKQRDNLEATVCSQRRLVTCSNKDTLNQVQGTHSDAYRNTPHTVNTHI
jgi:hypothetical protein